MLNGALGALGAPGALQSAPCVWAVNIGCLAAKHFNVTA